MTRPGALALATLAFLVTGTAARAQSASLAVGAAVPAGGMTSSAGTGIDIALQVRTEPLIGPLPLRIEIGYDHFAGKGAIATTTISAEAVSLTGDLGERCYWFAGPGYYQSNHTTQIAGHNVNDQRSYLGAQAGLGVNIPVFRWQGYLEAGGVKLFTPGSSLVYVPLRFGIHL